MSFEKTPGWLDWYAGPSKPAFKLPPGAVDAHCHVFGPGNEFPFAPERKYTPCDASKQQLFALRDHLGFARNVVVQATCHGTDNRALVDALVHSGGRARGVATVSRDVTDAELRAMHEAGVRGTRFNFVKRLVDFTPREVLTDIAHRLHRTPGSTKDYLSWLEDVDILGVVRIVEEHPPDGLVDSVVHPQGHRFVGGVGRAATQHGIFEVVAAFRLKSINAAAS